MIPCVHILASCPTPAALPYTLLVFDTLRVGFPTAKATVYANGDDAIAHFREIETAANRIGSECFAVPPTIHHRWIEGLLASEKEPFWILDTDLVFYGKVEDWAFNAPLAGWRIPEWRDDFSRCITRARLHTSLLWIDPVKVKAELEKFKGELPDGPFTPFVNPIYPLVVPFKGKRYFYDTCSLLFHAVGGTAFTDAQLGQYFHANFGCIESLVLCRLPDADKMKAVRDAVLKNPALGHGAWRSQMAYFQNRQV
jgi:hypothetical protein